MRERTYCVYVMSSLSQTLYTGVTNDLERRIFEHKERKPGSFTARYHVNRLVYFEEIRRSERCDRAREGDQEDDAEAEDRSD